MTHVLTMGSISYTARIASDGDAILAGCVCAQPRVHALMRRHDGAGELAIAVARDTQRQPANTFEAVLSREVPVAPVLGLLLLPQEQLHLSMQQLVQRRGCRVPHAQPKRLQGRDGFGPATAQSRYVLEDCPYGLVMVAKLGRKVGRVATLHEAGINILSAMYGRDFTADNDLLDALEFDAMSLEELRRRAAAGYLETA